jgi:uncharacterized protein
MFPQNKILFSLGTQMANMQKNTLTSFKRKLSANRKKFRSFLTKMEKAAPKHIDTLTEKIDAEVWAETDCLSCANCCKKMTPTFTATDLKRIAPHFGQTPAEFKAQWLEQDKNSDWVNKIQPCQFLNLKDNKCSIYDIRPVDCSGFPHLKKKKFTDYAHVHKQNIDYCPATFKMVEKLQILVNAGK